MSDLQPISNGHYNTSRISSSRAIHQVSHTHESTRSNKKSDRIYWAGAAPARGCWGFMRLLLDSVSTQHTCTRRRVSYMKVLLKKEMRIMGSHEGILARPQVT